MEAERKKRRNGQRSFRMKSTWCIWQKRVRDKRMYRSFKAAVGAQLLSNRRAQYMLTETVFCVNTEGTNELEFHQLSAHLLSQLQTNWFVLYGQCRVVWACRILFFSLFQKSVISDGSFWMKIPISGHHLYQSVAGFVLIIITEQHWHSHSLLLNLKTVRLVEEMKSA
jgi:hypothetical protein